MDGYVITEKWEDAMAAFKDEGVRYVAELDDGMGFVAFEGAIPCEGTVLKNVDENAFWWHSVRRMTPEVKVRHHGPLAQMETFGLFTTPAFLSLPGAVVLMASPIVGDLVLAITRGPQAGAFWSANPVVFRDIRISEGALQTA